MSDFKAKMHQIRFPLGLCPRSRSESSQRSPRPPQLELMGSLRSREGGTGRMEKGRERDGEGGEEEGEDGREKKGRDGAGKGER